MTLECMMGAAAFYLIVLSCGIHAVVPTVAVSTDFQERTTLIKASLSNATKELSKLFHKESVLAESKKRQWKCPLVTDVTDISCTCDIPHTVRCRGHASDPETLLALTKELTGDKDSTEAVSLLDLAIHGIGHLPPLCFHGLPLLGLIVSTAGLESLSQSSFKGLENTLAALGLPSNKLMSVPAESLKILRKLQRLDLSDNSLGVLNSHEFPTLLQLQNVNLAENGLRLIQPEAFVGLPQLKTLNLGRNQLDASQINEKTLWGLHFLSELSLQFNLLKGTLSPTFLNAAPELTSLDLSHNALTKIAFGTLQNCKNLQMLDLSHNKIDIIEDHAFKHLPKLHELQLSHNQIISVSGWSLAHLPQLSILSLADNALFAVTADLLHQLPNLTSLDLAANDISLLQPDVFNFTQFLSKLSLADNPLHCDCSLAWLWTWLQTHPHLTTSDKKSIVCTTPPSLENAPLFELNMSDLTCSKDVPDYYHDEAGDYDGLEELRLSNAEVSLQAASWVDDFVQLVWQIDQRAVPYTCQGVHIYEMEKIKGSVHQILAEKVGVNCSSESQVNPHQIVVTVPGSLLRPGGIYRYCLVLIEHGTGDEESFLPGCSDALLLAAPPSEISTDTKEIQVTSLTAGSMGMALVVQTRLNSHHFPCYYSVYVVTDRVIAASRQLNCSEARHAFPSLVPGTYMVCVEPINESNAHNLNELQQILRTSTNTTATLNSKFPACTTVHLQDETSNNWSSGPLLTLLFTLPGLALIITLYVIGRRVWKGGGVPWRWDPRANKRAKYFLYTGETTTPTVSLDPLPIPTPESSV